MTRARTALSASVALGLAAAIGLAAPPARAQQLAADRDRQPRSETEGQAPPDSGDLSNRLDRSHGVIAPPQTIDPQMQVRPPNPDAKMPIVPPPGSPGGNEAIEPK